MSVHDRATMIWLDSLVTCKQGLLLEFDKDNVDDQMNETTIERDLELDKRFEGFENILQLNPRLYMVYFEGSPIYEDCKIPYSYVLVMIASMKISPRNICIHDLSRMVLPQKWIFYREC